MGQARVTSGERAGDGFDYFEPDGPLAWLNNNRLVGLTELPVKAFPR